MIRFIRFHMDFSVRDAIPGAALLILEGAGHDLPKPLWDVFLPALLKHTRGGRR